jgi:iron-sulfur cluster assembly accessory protein
MNAPVETTARPMLTLTEVAQAKLVELMADAGEEVVGVRVFVAGGGCSGMGYGMTFADRTSDFDHVSDHNGLKVIVDTVALNYLGGAEIDFTADRMNPSFVFRNTFQSQTSSDSSGGGRCGGCGGGCGR